MTLGFTTVHEKRLDSRFLAFAGMADYASSPRKRRSIDDVSAYFSWKSLVPLATLGTHETSFRAERGILL